MKTSFHLPVIGIVWWKWAALKIYLSNNFWLAMQLTEVHRLAIRNRCPSLNCMETFQVWAFTALELLPVTRGIHSRLNIALKMSVSCISIDSIYHNIKLNLLAMVVRNYQSIAWKAYEKWKGYKTMTNCLGSGAATCRWN